MSLEIRDLLSFANQFNIPLDPSIVDTLSRAIQSFHSSLEAYRDEQRLAMVELRKSIQRQTVRLYKAFKFEILKSFSNFDVVILAYTDLGRQLRAAQTQIYTKEEEISRQLQQACVTDLSSSASALLMHISKSAASYRRSMATLETLVAKQHTQQLLPWRLRMALDLGSSMRASNTTNDNQVVEFGGDIHDSNGEGLLACVFD
jgi:hypothetical protein